MKRRTKFIVCISTASSLVCICLYSILVLKFKDVYTFEENPALSGLIQSLSYTNHAAVEENVDLSHQDNDNSDHVNKHNIKVDKDTDLSSQINAGSDITNGMDVPTNSSGVNNLAHSQVKNGSCNFHEFRDSMSVDPETPYLPIGLLQYCYGVIHNRVPKSASRTMLDVYREMSKHHINHDNISVIFIDNQFEVAVGGERERMYVNQMKQVENGKFVLISHHYFNNFTRLEPWPQIYVNVLREPTSWFISNFCWHKEYYNQTVPWTRMTLSECIHTSDCFDLVRARFGPMRFLCGLRDECKYNTEETVDMVKKRIDEDYLLVGVLDELAEFNMVLEYLMPEIFTGLVAAFNVTQEDSLTTFKTKSKETLTEKDRSLLRAKMVHETEVYEYAKRKFDNMLRAVRILKSREHSTISQS